MSFNIPADSPIRQPSFVYGVATAAFQIEGDIHTDGRVDSIWDVFCREPGRVLNADNGEPACQHYRLWEQDLDLLKDLGVDAYRLSIAWPRIVPARGEVNELGLAFYERLIDGLITRGIKPVVTLYHWDLPYYLEEKGGWLNRETAYAFAEYAEVVVGRLGNKVTHWATFNEPFCSSFLSYQIGVHAPGYQEPAWAYTAAHHLLLAHGLALPIMRGLAPESEHGIVLNFTPAYPATDSAADQAAADRTDIIDTHWFICPLLTGEYYAGYFDQHPELKPVIFPGDMALISQTVDFIGVNFYTRHVVRDHNDASEFVPQTGAEHTHIGWEVYPEALTYLLVKLHQTYANLPPMFITENGMAGDDHLTADGKVNDEQRVRYYERHLTAVGEAMKQGVDMRGYFAWSLMDNFEWAFGYSQRFGLVYVDYDTQERTVKRSGELYKAWIAEQRGR
ncbi:GH1 family beta-glucosidase [Salinispirillum marinum]|uniref:Beta-glucosidase n=2 Tax=Saccharospirillaceae TaxID=255527 RepID=A0ABV8BBH5_9GAMM